VSGECKLEALRRSVQRERRPVRQRERLHLPLVRLHPPSSAPPPSVLVASSCPLPTVPDQRQKISPSSASSVLSLTQRPCLSPSLRTVPAAMLATVRHSLKKAVTVAATATAVVRPAAAVAVSRRGIVSASATPPAAAIPAAKSSLFNARLLSLAVAGSLGVLMAAQMSTQSASAPEEVSKSGLSSKAFTPLKVRTTHQRKQGSDARRTTLGLGSPFDLRCAWCCVFACLCFPLLAVASREIQPQHGYLHVRSAQPFRETGLACVVFLPHQDHGSRWKGHHPSVETQCVQRCSPVHTAEH
jgi:hypothetical protein